ncbi:YiiX/YebB-like N1pC/P60 family cysteine hydrolase [Halomonas elongata]|uniref:YiiX/YebB-like N1pC/P60 family cysteine hydrolase n=1 Tax=Halomonas elongata (strain ATCC 33173 / DSM 2581 / NBRC 15536 / NCIMB 2198 / 1H9) TaxID=768066 RepID=E1V6P8_HALED|nr:YiiX/YebB-like N1pC/P60 family cysteine hydrolase [Halomonas elongata]MBW5800991.1 hypothetical protein [Halomonas elongata]MDL4861370.1 YiiX/YebB-like N1pC/P60 family cysteine hydrolase [Halomonas elongata]RAW05951.1 hypothetical protein DKQ62_16475 [Halomonas elongata]WBF18614.1 hypothetical protein LM502_02620 [Halomonas elongata]WPU47468.1 YiiX/YebB-like N1pC/P60 family cysteine hydrolase [Halomonas elongata DSM 2581]
MEDKLLITVKSLLLLALCLLAGTCQASQLLPGDLVFRQGTEPVSEAVMVMDDNRFSHVGMLAGQPDDWQVVHAVPEGGVISEPLADYIAAEHARQFAYFRVKATDAQRQSATDFAEANLGVPFTLLDAGVPGNGTYCTLLIRDAWQAAGIDLQAKFKHLNLPLYPGDFLLPSGLLASPLVSPVLQDTDSPS